MRRLLAAVLPVLAAAACGEQERRPAVLELWERGEPAFGVFVPEDPPERGGAPGGDDGGRAGSRFSRETGERLAANPLHDFVFLNLERGYTPRAVEAVEAGLRSTDAGRRTALLVRIPPIAEAGRERTATRVREVLDRGADGVVLPHVRGLEEARLAVRIVEEAGADVWTPRNPEGRTVAMLMLEDPEAVAQAPEIADLEGYSVLACGIGSLTGALGGDREAAETGNRRVLREARRVGRPDMITADAESVGRRIEEGFLALLATGEDPDRVIRLGRKAAGR